MLISFLVNEVSGGWSPSSTRLGGTEESVVKWAEALECRGNRVEVFHNSTNGHYEEVNNVIYQPRANYIGGGDVCINIKCSDIDPRERTFYFTNETDATRLDLRKYDGVIWPSHWAADNIPVNNPNVFVVPHGYDPEAIYPSKKVPKQCFYASSPDRGLELLLRVWPKVYEAHPDATLIVTYGVKGLNIPGVICLGDVPEEMMNDVYRSSSIWCHPASGGELFCITGVKAQVAKCWPVIIPTMALSETVKYGTFCTPDNYAEKLIEALSEPHKIPDYDYPDWEATTDILSDIITVKK